MKQLALFCLFLIGWLVLFSGLTLWLDPLRKTVFADYNSGIPDIGQNAQDILDMKMALYLRDPKPNIILGNSRPYKGFPAEALGDDWFNFSIPGANMKDLFFLTEFLTECDSTLTSIKKIILALDLSVYDLGRGNETARNFEENIHSRKCKSESKLASVLTDITTHPSYFIDPLNIWRSLKNEENSYTLHGTYLTHPDRLKKTAVLNASRSKMEDYLLAGWGVRGVWDNKQNVDKFFRSLSYFEKVSSLTEQKDIELMVVWTPIHASLLAVKNIKGLLGTYYELQEQSFEIGRQYGVVFYDFTGPDPDTMLSLTYAGEDGKSVYFTEPSHFTSALGVKLANRLQTDTPLSDIEALRGIQERSGYIIREKEGDWPILDELLEDHCRIFADCP